MTMTRACPVRAWLHGIMNNVLFETMRTIRRQPAQESADSAAWERLAVDLHAARRDTVPSRLDVADCLAKLPSEYREVLQLRFTDGLESRRDSRSGLGISTGNARVRLCRAINAAKAIAGADPAGGPAMNPNDRRLQLDLVAARYLAALERDDFHRNGGHLAARPCRP